MDFCPSFCPSNARIFAKKAPVFHPSFYKNEPVWRVSNTGGVLPPPSKQLSFSADSLEKCRLLRARGVPYPLTDDFFGSFSFYKTDDFQKSLNGHWPPSTLFFGEFFCGSAKERRHWESLAMPPNVGLVTNGKIVSPSSGHFSERKNAG